MYEKIKKIIAVMLAIGMMIGESSVVFGKNDDELFVANVLEEDVKMLDEAIVNKYVNAVNAGIYADIAQLFHSNDREDLEEFFQGEVNKSERNGVYNVEYIHAYEIIEMESVDQVSTWTADEIASYLVYMDCDVYESNQYYKEGSNFFKLVTGTESGNRVILEFSVASNELVSTEIKNVENVVVNVEYEDYVQDREQIIESLQNFELKNVWQETQSGVSTFAAYTPKTLSSYKFPSTIRVRKTSDGVVYTKNFKEYCYVVLASEFGVGTKGTKYPHTEALKVMSLCIRNFAWYRSLYPYNATAGYDVTDNTNTQTYKWSLEGTVSSDFPRHVQAMDDMWDVMMFDGDKKLFIPSYLAGGYDDKRSTGEISVVYQNGANYLATEEGYSYKEILKYYYLEDGYQILSAPIIVCDSHVRVSKYYTTALQHGKACSTCGHIEMSAHIWTTSGSSYRCKICGYTSAIIPNIKE